ncbi:hypothetical protein HQQ75_27025 [Corallococcus exiguus]|nr:hypothetical protein [Corallococcus exiguus]
MPLRTLLAILVLQLPPRPAFDAGTPDAGPFVWDGTYTELEEQGDWVDRGPFAPCGFDSRDAPSSACEELPRFDVSNCAPAALARLPEEGICLANTRDERRLEDGGTLISTGPVSFQLRSDGGTSTLYDEPLRFRDTQRGQQQQGRPCLRPRQSRAACLCV